MSKPKFSDLGFLNSILKLAVLKVHGLHMRKGS
jgi:hypothetical protein